MIRPSKWIGLIGAAGLLACAICGCSAIDSLTQKFMHSDKSSQNETPQVQEANDAIFLGERQAPALGQAVAAAVLGRYGLVSDPKLTRYVNLVGLTMASVSDRPDGNWCFAVLNTDQVNSYGGPDGYVMITLGALRQMHDEAELAGVLGNEISHVIHHDAMHAAQAALRPRTPATTQSTLTADQRNARFGQAADAVAEVVLVKGYDSSQEDAADAGAVSLLLAAGYDPASYLKFVQRMAQAQPQGGVAVFPTHPGLSDRAAKIQGQISQLSAAGGRSNQGRFVEQTAAQ
jgi:predicted Zn-dependent protease